MERRELETLARDLEGRADMLTLATAAPGGFPSIRALFNLRNAAAFPGLVPFFAGRSPFTAWLGTNTSSVKAAEIDRDPRVAVYYMLPAEFTGLMLQGVAVPDEEARKALWVDGWERYYPQGRDDPDYRVFRVDAIRVRGWHGGQSFSLEL